MVKVVSLFLIGMLVLAMFGRLRFPGQKRLQAMKCKRCGKYKIGQTCSCGQKG